jgi:hypothetical protein
MEDEFMHFEILVEDLSGKIALDILIPKIIDGERSPTKFTDFIRKISICVNPHLR